MRAFTKASLRGVSALLIALGLPFAGASCQSIIGVDDRELGPCSHFCDVVMQNCKDENLVYENRDKCMGVCKLLPVGDSNEWQNSNTIECRLHEAELAASSGAEDVSRACRSAGPEGLDCGGSCQSYCFLYEQACGQVQCGSTETCEQKCAALRDRGAYNVVDDYEGNSIQCRFVHLSNASIVKGGQPHCGHANLSTPTDHCTDVPDSDSDTGAGGNTSMPDGVKPAEPDCDDYCRVITVACGTGTTPTAQYESKEQCQALCPFFDTGAFADTNQNTLGCRIYHSYNSLCSSEFHCPHAGPGGEGHCGANPTDKCASYCTLAQRVCADKYPYASDEECVDACSNSDMPDRFSMEDGDTRYDVTYAGANPGTLACRFLALSRAAQAQVSRSTDASFCEAAFGAGSCTAP